MSVCLLATSGSQTLRFVLLVLVALPALLRVLRKLFVGWREPEEVIVFAVGGEAFLNFGWCPSPAIWRQHTGQEYKPECIRDERCSNLYSDGLADMWLGEQAC